MIEEKVSLKSKLWLSGADGLCGVLCGLITGGGFTVFFTRWMGLDSKKASLVWLLFGIWNAVNDPLFGFISDRTKSKIGRRRPYIRYGAPIYAVIFVLCWIKWPFAGNQWGMFLQMLISLFLFDTLYTCIATSLYVMPYEIAISNKQRGSIFIFKLIFSLFSLAVPLILMPMIQLQPGEDPLTFQLIMAGIGIIAGAIIFFSTFFYSEKGYIKEEEQPNFIKALLICFKNKPFIIFETISFTVIYIQNSLSLGVNYYFPELGMSMVPCYGALLVGAIFGIVLWINKQIVWGVRKCVMVMCIVFSVGCFAMAFFGGVLPVAVLGFFTVGFGFAGGMYLIPLMNGDVIDYDESLTSLRREGMYAGVNSLITKPAMSIATAAFLTIIDIFGYDSTLELGKQSASAERGILIGWMLIPAILLLLCFLAMFKYTLKGDKWNETKNELEKIHNEKEKEYIKSLGFEVNE
ncbi:MFS transporter [Anaeromicropila herbilytica]|uniref:Sodium:melibiose symporter n=1 Tax=Anaeromicropila herbilytica TaxID=2785025 RepID=A0A7R7EIC9_9FIRM|nr:MFS transporter [Anaeromicropila herbilytica]BCN29323.1 sodium:melibiose symporter [Anaeromicropila herbilytica]